MRGDVKPPGQALREQLGDVDDGLDQVLNVGALPAAQAMAVLAAMQVKATCALAHAVRELTEAVRSGRP